MKLFNLFKKEKQVEEKSETDILLLKLDRINRLKASNYDILGHKQPKDGFFTDKIYPWASDKSNTENITVGDVILLWWIGNKRTNKNKIPKYLSQNYFKNVPSRIDELANKGLIDNTGEKPKLTNEGEKVVTDNDEFVQLHRNNYQTLDQQIKMTELSIEYDETYLKLSELGFFTNNDPNLREYIQERKDKLESLRANKTNQ